jgi:hypothetical protein
VSPEKAMGKGMSGALRWVLLGCFGLPWSEIGKLRGRTRYQICSLVRLFTLTARPWQSGVQGAVHAQAVLAIEAIPERVAFVRPWLVLKHVPMKTWNAGFLPGF